MGAKVEAGRYWRILSVTWVRHGDSGSGGDEKWLDSGRISSGADVID